MNSHQPGMTQCWEGSCEEPDEVSQGERQTRSKFKGSSRSTGPQALVPSASGPVTRGTSGCYLPLAATSASAGPLGFPIPHMGGPDGSPWLG